MRHFLEFEKPIAELEAKIEELRHLSNDEDLNIVEEISRLQKKVEKQYTTIYSRLSPWQKTLVARHPERPHAKEYIDALFEQFSPLAGDRLYSEDDAIIGGMGRFKGMACVVLGIEKGHDTDTRLKHNFGMARPEGYRKSQRLMKLAEQFNLPLVAFVDTSGAYPGMGAEERGQAEAIARSIDVSLGLKTPFISFIIGEGGSGGAVALATANKVHMLSHAVYSVISPEGCASILWRSREQAEMAADALKLTAQDLKQLELIDEIIEEPLGGAHRHPEAIFSSVADRLYHDLQGYIQEPDKDYSLQRREKFLKMSRQFIQ